MFGALNRAQSHFRVSFEFSSSALPENKKWENYKSRKTNRKPYTWAHRHSKRWKRKISISPHSRHTETRNELLTLLAVQIDIRKSQMLTQLRSLSSLRKMFTSYVCVVGISKDRAKRDRPEDRKLRAARRNMMEEVINFKFLPLKPFSMLLMLGPLSPADTSSVHCLCVGDRDQSQLSTATHVKSWGGREFLLWKINKTFIPRFLKTFLCTATAFGVKKPLILWWIRD